MSEEQKYRQSNLIATVVIAISAIVLVTLPTKGIFSGYLLEILLAIALIILKLVNPKIPASQIGLLAVAIFLANSLASVLFNLTGFPFFDKAADLAIQFICVSGFGAYWVAKKYVPAHRNKW